RRWLRLASPVLSFAIRCYSVPLSLHSFPTRRSSDLGDQIWLSGHFLMLPYSMNWADDRDLRCTANIWSNISLAWSTIRASNGTPDRKSTRLNSSHVKISYAVFCLKKKTRTRGPPAEG